MAVLEQTLKQINTLSSLDAVEGFLKRIPDSNLCQYAGIYLESGGRYIGDIPTPVREYFEGKADDSLCAHEQLKTSRPFTFKLDELPHVLHLVIPASQLRQQTRGIIVGLPTKLEEQQLIEKFEWYWRLIGSYLLDIVYLEMTPSVTFSLTPREKECMNWAAKGKTSWEISQILGITERTVNFHINNCIQKTNSTSRQQVISKLL